MGGMLVRWVSLVGLAIALGGWVSPQAHAQAERVVYNFQGGSDGFEPSGSLIYSGGLFYGTTQFGGNFGNTNCGPAGCGTVFSLTPRGAKSVVYSFTGGADGCNPAYGVQSTQSIFYGTAVNCGGADWGTVFSLTPAGGETPLHAFGGPPAADGWFPQPVLAVAGKGFYGTTTYGGRNCPSRTSCGEAYSLSSTGTYKLLHKFDDFTANPIGNLLAVGTTFYGVTSSGGTHHLGTVFKMTPFGAVTVLHSFGGTGDGSQPTAGLIQLNGKFYGTTEAGGTFGQGTVFSITPTGTEAVLYSFTGGADGGQPMAGLAALGGRLYGTTTLGGDTSCQKAGCGTVFGVTPAGGETTLHSFAGPIIHGKDGAFPSSGLLNVNGTLYGVTTCGGASANPVYAKACTGTVYTVKP